MAISELIPIILIAIVCYFTFFLLYIKNKIIKDNQEVNANIINELEKKQENIERTLHNHVQDSEKTIIELEQLILKNKDLFLSKIKKVIDKISLYIQENTEQHSEILKLIYAIKVTNQQQEINIKHLLTSFQVQKESLKNFSTQFNELEKFLSEKTELMQSDYNMTLELLKINWLDDLTKETERAMEKLLR